MRRYRKIIGVEDRHIGDRAEYSVVPHHVLECGHAVPVRVPRSSGEAIASLTIKKRHCYKCATTEGKLTMTHCELCKKPYWKDGREPIPGDGRYCQVCASVACESYRERLCALEAIAQLAAIDSPAVYEIARIARAALT